MLALYGVSVVGSSHIPGIEDEYGLMGLVRTYIECEIAKSIDYCDPRVIKFLNSDFLNLREWHGYNPELLRQCFIIFNRRDGEAFIMPVGDADLGKYKYTQLVFQLNQQFFHFQLIR